MAMIRPDNPGEAQARRLESVDAQLATLLRQPEVLQRLRAAPGENEWSVTQILGHMVEMIPYWLDHCRRLIAATGEPPTFGRTLGSPERLAGVEQGARGEPEDLTRMLHEQVQAAARAIREMSPEERSKKGMHVREGEITVAEAIERFIVHHAEEHLAQVRAAVQG
jgi:uncharacterized damage-inducible protein DinB